MHQKHCQHVAMSILGNIITYLNHLTRETFPNQKGNCNHAELITKL
jgi:hypothetical protein